MDRRDFVKTAGAGAVAGLFGGAMAFAAEHKHDHGKMTAKRRAMSPQLKAVVDTAYDCIRKAESCLSVCQATLDAGDTSMAECQKTVLNMIAGCEALATLASYNTANEKHIKAIAKACADLCRDCEKECEKHASHHAECKDCLDGCRACIKACEAYVKA